MTKNKVVMLIAAAFALAGPVALRAQQPQLNETRYTLKQWVELKKLVSEEKANWKVEKQTLDESINLLESEIEKLKTAIADQEEGASDADKARSDLTAQEDSLKEASAVVRSTIGDLEAMTLDLVEYLPKATKDKLTIVTQRIPRTTQAMNATTLSVRIMNVIGVLTEIEKFNSQITVDNEIQDIDGTKVRVDTIYIGLAVAYYVDGTKSESGYMIPAKGGWKKFQDNSLAESVASAIAMQKREATAEFVNLPISVTNVE